MSFGMNESGVPQQKVTFLPTGNKMNPTVDIAIPTVDKMNPTVDKSDSTGKKRFQPY